MLAIAIGSLVALAEMLGVGALVYYGVERLVERTLERSDAGWQRVIAAQEHATREAISTAAFGGPRQPAQVSRDEPPQERMEREVSDDMIRAGIEQLRAAYADRGMAFSEAELREEVIALATQGGLG